MSTVMSTRLSPTDAPEPLASEAFALEESQPMAFLKSSVESSAGHQAESFTKRLDAQLASDYGLVNKQSEWNSLSKALYLGQSKTVLLLGDEGLGKSSFINAYFKALAQHREATGLYAPHQAIKLQLSLLPKAQWATWHLEDLLYNALNTWCVDTLASIQNDANQRLHDVGIRINDEQFKLLLTQFSEEIVHERRYNLWLNTLKQALSKKQNLIQKWTATSQEALEETARILNNPWAVVAFQVQASLAQDGQASAEIAERFMELAQAVKTLVATEETPASFSLLIDEWERVGLQSPTVRDANNKSLLRLLKNIHAQQKQTPFLLTLTSRTEALSQQLTSPLYTLFRDKVLLSTYSEKDLKALIKVTNRGGETQGFVVPQEAFPILSDLSQGQGYKALAVYQAWVKKAQQHNETRLSLESLDALAIDNAEDLDALFYARLQLDALAHGTTFLNALQLVVAHLDHTPFTVESFINERLKTAPQGILPNHLGLALRKLYLYGIVQKLETTRTSPVYSVPSRHALEGLYAFFSPKSVEALFQKTQGLKPSNHALTTLSENEASTEEPPIETALSRTAFLEQGEALVQILPKTFQEGELSLEKLQSVLSYLNELPRENAERLRGKIAGFLVEAVHGHPLEARRLEGLLCLGYLPLPTALKALVNALKHADPIVQQHALQSLRQWILTATEAKVPLQDKVLPVVESLLEQLNPREGSPRKEDALIQSMVFDVLKQWHKGEARSVFKGVQAYLQERLNRGNDDYLSIALLDCLLDLLKPFQAKDLETRMPWVLSVVEKALVLPDLQTSAFALLRLLPAPMPQVQVILNDLLGEQRFSELGDEAFQYASESLGLPVLQATPPQWLEAFHRYVERLYQPHSLEASLQEEAFRQRLIQSSLHLLKIVRTWNASEKEQLSKCLEETLASPQWQVHLDLLWILLRLKQQVTINDATTESTDRYLGQIPSSPTSHLVKQLLNTHNL